MKSLVGKLTAQRKWRSRTLLMGMGIACAAGLSGCIVVQDGPRAQYPEPVPQPQPVAVEQPVYAPQPVEVVDVYQNELSPYGHWVQTRYGQCWVYDNRPYGWRPYTIGHWINTEDGWCWVAEGSETAWGETCYHYGRWYQDDAYGWVWVPGRVWGPGWVSWREGDGYAAWAPLPPECPDGQPVQVVVIDRYVPQDRYVVVDERYIGQPAVYQHVERNNVTIINRTTNITNVTYVDNRVINHGVAVEHVEQRSGRPVEQVNVTRVSNAADARRLVAEGKPVHYAPPAVESYAKSHPPVRVAPARVVKPKPANDYPAQESSTARQGQPNHGVQQPPARPQPRPEVEPQPRPQVEPRPRPEARPEPEVNPSAHPAPKHKPVNEPLGQESSTARQGQPNEGEAPAPKHAAKPRPEVEPRPRPEARPEPQAGENPSAHPVVKPKPKPGQKPEEPKEPQ